jgi:hypothetical protein
VSVRYLPSFEEQLYLLASSLFLYKRAHVDSDKLIDFVNGFLQHFFCIRGYVEVQWGVFLCSLRPVWVPYAFSADRGTRFFVNLEG